MGSHRLFRSFWWATNALFAFALLATLLTGIWEHSVRQYLKGFSDAIIPESSTSRQKAEAILAWMSYGPPRREAPDPSLLSPHDPTDTLNYRQLLEVCGSATNAFLNLSRSSGLEARRLLLLSPDRTAKHVVAEVRLDGRWVIVDATYRTMMKDAQGRLLTRADLQDPRLFQEAIAYIPGYIPVYSYERVAHVRVGALPVLGPILRRALDSVMPGWDEFMDWSLLLERRSFAFFFLSVWALIFFFLLRIVLAWVADHRLLIPRLHLRTSLTRATATFFSTPEMK
ncbi:MAG TPA: transglutaminase-like domain-containing protein [Candidatus Acidoferrum sp.]|nr:transglutaminase-like domain-containing protein [Candidatus Acidoferrum sp.]